MCVYVRVLVVVCLHWACETREETLHTLGPGTVGEEEEKRSNTLSGFESVFVRELVRTIQDVTKTKPKVNIWTEMLEGKKKNPL